MHTAILVIAYGVAPNPPADAEELIPLLEARRLITRHCVPCHGGEETYAGVQLSTLSDELDVWRNNSTWGRALAVIESGEMPPEEGVALGEKDRSMLAAWIGHTVANVDYARIPRDPGHVPPRRLTGREYNHTVQDLFGLKGKTHEFPEDLVIGDGFDNSADTLAFSALWFENALEAADATVRAVWSDSEALDRLLFVRPTPPPIEDEALYVASKETSAECDTSGDFSVVARVRGFPERIFLRAPRGVDGTLGVKEFFFHDEGIGYRVSRRRVIRAPAVELEEDEDAWVGLSVRDGVASIYFNGLLLVRRPGFERADAPGHLLKIGFFEEEEDEDDDDEDVEDRPASRTDRVQARRVRDFRFFTSGLPDGQMQLLTSIDTERERPTSAFHWVAGTTTPPPEDFVTREQAIEQVLRRFLLRAFRRPPTPAEMDRYSALLLEGLDDGLTFEIALQKPVATALSSPAFLLRSDSIPDAEDLTPLTGFDLASRLSYFLWASTPDDELLRVAADGALTEPAALLRQVERLLSDSRSQRFYDGFVLQWLGTGGLGDTIRPSAESFPDVTESLLASMRNEGPRFFGDAVEKDHPLLYLIDAPHVIVDAELAEHYGYGSGEDDGWRQVALKDKQRGGVLTQAGVLTVSSSPQRTSPVFRGKWLLEVLLGDPPPPPPPNVPSLPPSDEGGATSLRESLELHRSQPACSGCHSRIDPFGLALEQYDAIGALRTEPQDTRATLPDGKELDGAATLKAYLSSERRDQFERHLIRKMLAYAVGRDLRFADERAVHEIVTELEKSGGGVRALVRGIVLSEPFRYRLDPPATAADPLSIHD